MASRPHSGHRSSLRSDPSSDHRYGAHGVLIAIPASLALWAIIGVLIF